VQAGKNVVERHLRELEAAMKLRDEFLLVAGHELKTPLTTIKLQLTTVKTEAELPERILRRVKAVERQTARLLRLSNELVDVTRLTAGRLALNLEEVDLCGIIRDAAAQLEFDLRHSGSSLHLELPEAMIGRWDPQRIEHIVTNLLSNAIKYGEGKPLHVSAAAIDTSAHLVVRDHGMGIKPEDRERVFERFERAVSPQQYGGLGLGLWIVREVCRAHGGAVRIESPPGGGSAFIVDLPLAR
jgi:signal transduction histidine kinase